MAIARESWPFPDLTAMFNRPTPCKSPKTLIWGQSDLRPTWAPFPDQNQRPDIFSYRIYEQERGTSMPACWSWAKLNSPSVVPRQSTAKMEGGSRCRTAYQILLGDRDHPYRHVEGINSMKMCPAISLPIIFSFPSETCVWTMWMLRKHCSKSTNQAKCQSQAIIGSTV